MAPDGDLTIDREYLSDASGPVVEYQRGVRAETAYVAVVAPGRTVSEAVSAATELLPGWRLTTSDEGLVQGLIAAGAQLTRRYLLMSCPLTTIEPRPLPVEFSLGAVPSTSDIDQWEPILQSWQDAFPPGHPDHLDTSDPATAVQFFMNLVDGSEMGPMHRSSCLLVDAEGRARAGIIVNVRGGEPPEGGAWISDIWRDPSLRATGVGPSLIDRAKIQLLEDGYTALSLAVTTTNQAVRTYEREGFAVVMDTRILQLSTDRP